MISAAGIDTARWQQLPLATQLGNIASELSRALSLHRSNAHPERDRALERALELADATLRTSHGVRTRELARLRSTIANNLVDREASWLPSLVTLLLPSATLARTRR